MERFIPDRGSFSTTRKLLDNIELRLAQETGGTVGNVIPVPNLESSAQLQTDLQGLKGKTVLVESTSTGWGSGSSHGNPERRLHAKAHGRESARKSWRSCGAKLSKSLLAACGVPVTVLDASQGKCQREKISANSFT